MDDDGEGIAVTNGHLVLELEEDEGTNEAAHISLRAAVQDADALYELGDRYDARALRNAIKRAVARANKERKKAGEKLLPKWTPYQLRHAALTRTRTLHGIEGAKAQGGHSTTVVTQGYTVQADRDLARRIAAEHG